MRAALVANYPEIGLDRYFHVPNQHWKNKENCRKHFLQFSISRGFDPLVASNWFPYLDVSLKELRPVLRNYEYSLMRALTDLYPTHHQTNPAQIK